MAKTRAKAFKYTGGEAPNVVDENGKVISTMPSEFVMGVPARDLDEHDIANIEDDIYDLMVKSKATHGGLLYEEVKSDKGESKAEAKATEKP